MKAQNLDGLIAKRSDGKYEPGYVPASRNGIRPMSFFQSTELYARRALEVSEAVALLVDHRQVGPEVVCRMQEIGRRRSLCFEAAERFERFVQEGEPMSDA